MPKKKLYRYSTGETIEADVEDLKPPTDSMKLPGWEARFVQLNGGRRVRGARQWLLRPQVQ